MNDRRRPREDSLTISSSNTPNTISDKINSNNNNNNNNTINNTNDISLAMIGDPGDMTEACGTGSEEAELVYGGAFYLQEEYFQKQLRQRDLTHRGNNNNNNNNIESDNGEIIDSGKGIRRETQKAVDIIVNTALQPLFFKLGHDFPAVLPPSSIRGNNNNYEEEISTSTTVDNESILTLAGSEANSEIIMPIVSANCKLVQSATKGSAALIFLRRQQETERAMRETMDTSKSDLTKLLRKGDVGQQLIIQNEKQQQGINVNVLNMNIKEGDGNNEDNDEAEMLRRKIRKETVRLEQNLNTSSSSFNNNNNNNNTKDKEDEVEREERALQYANILRRRQEKMERVQDAKERIIEASTHTDEYAIKRLTLLDMQRQLPIYRCKEELLRCIGENPVSIVVGETGSGKTTQLVQYLYQRGYTRAGGIIGCTQPRRLAAIGVARRVSEEMGCALGTCVGYAIHLDDCTTDETEIKFMTDGVLLREIVRDPDVEKYSVIIIDEAHERSVNTDVLLGVLRAAVRRRTDLKLIVTSATMDIMKFSKFFGNAPFYEIPGQTYEVELRYTPKPVEDYVAEAVFRVCQLHVTMPLEGKNDILVFMTGRDDVLGVCELIRRRLQEIDSKWLDTLLVLPCLSEAVSATSTGVLDPAPPGIRKCVVATNVAETSLTIDGIRYVVDCGFMKTNVFRPRLGMNTLQRYPVSQAQANQRKGRAGRTTEGLCFRLYTEAQFLNEMLVSSVPEIQRSSIDSVVLLLKSIGVSHLIEFDFMDPPPAANIRRSMWQLWVLGLLDDNGSITIDGRRALEFPLAPSLAKMLVDSTERGCGVEVIRVVSMISADPKSLFDLPKEREETARQHHGRFYANESDHLTLLNVMSQFIENGKSRQWARDQFLHAPTLLRACEVQQQLLEKMRQLKFPLISCGPNGLDLVRQCVASGFCLQSAKRSSTNWSEYRPMLNSAVTCFIHPSSAVCARAEMPLYVVYHDLLLTTREYLVMVTTVEPEWLVEASRGVFCVKGKIMSTANNNNNNNNNNNSLAASGTMKMMVNQINSFSSSEGTHISQSGKEKEFGRAQGGMGKFQPASTKPKGVMLPAKRRHNI